MFCAGFFARESTKLTRGHAKSKRKLYSISWSFRDSVQFDYNNGFGNTVGRFRIDLYTNYGSGDCGGWVGSICDKPDIGCKDSGELSSVLLYLHEILELSPWNLVLTYYTKAFHHFLMAHCHWRSSPSSFFPRSGVYLPWIMLLVQLETTTLWCQR